MRIAALPGDIGACGYYRVIAPLRAMERNGLIEEWWLPEAEKDSAGRPSMKVTNTELIGYDLAVFQRQPEERINELIHYLQGQGTRVVFDIDDDMFSIPPDNSSYVHWGRDWRLIGGHYKADNVKVRPGQQDTIKRDVLEGRVMIKGAKDQLERTRDNRAGLLRNIREADLVSVTTEKLRTIYSRYRQSVTVLPNQIEPRDWEDALAQPYERDDDQVWIGWAGSKTHWPDLKIIKTSILQVLRRHANARFCIVGMPEAAILFGAQQSQILTWDWMELDEYRRIVAAFDIIIAPSAPKTFNEAKSDLRVLEAGLCGKPIVGSPTTYGKTIKEAGCGYVAATPSKWIKYLSRLIRDADQRKKLGEKGRQYVLQNRTYDGNAWRWKQAYQKLMEVGS